MCCPGGQRIADMANMVLFEIHPLKNQKAAANNKNIVCRRFF
jgi:hypothetical protein